MNEIKNPDHVSSFFETAEHWYFELLRRELELRDQGESAIQLRYQLEARTTYEELQGSNKKLRLKIAHQMTDYEIRLNAQTGELISWYIDFLSVDGDTTMPREEALRLAAEFAQLPDGARLRFADYEVNGGRIVFRSRWEHYYNDLPVEGDYIEVLINGKNQHPFGYTRVWRFPETSGKSGSR